MCLFRIQFQAQFQFRLSRAASQLRALSLWLGFFLTNLSLVSLSAHAVTPGTSIDSIAIVSFSLNGNALILESSPTGNSLTGVGNGSQTRMTIDRGINFNLVSNDTPGAINSANFISVLSGQNSVVATFSVQNTGNASHDFVLTAVNSEVSGENNIDIPNTDIAVFVESGATLGYQSIEDTQQFINDLGAGLSQTVYVVSNIPSSASVDDFIALTLVAQIAESDYSDNISDVSRIILNDLSDQLSPTGVFETITVTGADLPSPDNPIDTSCNAANDHTATCEFQTVFADSAGVNPEDITSTAIKGDTDLASNGQSSDSVGYLITQSPVQVIKTQTVLSPIGAHPNASIRYNLTINILCRTDDILNVVIQDAIPALTTFISGSILFNSNTPTNSDFNTVGGVGFDVTNNRVVANLGTLAAQPSCVTTDTFITSHILSFDVLIN